MTGLGLDARTHQRTQFGHLLESFVIQELIAQSAWTRPGLCFYHYRDNSQFEVDCVITEAQKVWGVEIDGRCFDVTDMNGKTACQNFKAA